MERRRKPAARKARGGVNKNKTTVGQKSAGASFHLPNIADLITDGEITVGVLRPIGCVATACNEDSTLAMLVRRKGETLFQLLTRLDEAIAKAYNEDIFTDEINPPPMNPKRS